MAIRRVGSSAAPKQPENVKQAIADLIPEIETAGNKLVEDLEEFIGRLQGSSDPADKAAAQSVLQRLQNFSIQPEPAGGTSSATSPDQPTPRPDAVEKKGIVYWWKRAVENAREDGASSKSSNPEPKT